MPHVARVGVFLDLRPEQVAAAEHNLTVRLVPTVQVQPGFVAGLWAASRQPANGFSFSCFTNPATAQAAGMAINAAPLLPEQNPANLPEPSWVATGPVLWSYDTSRTATTVRLDIVDATHVGDDARAVFSAASIMQHPQLCRVFVVYEPAARRYVVLTSWLGTPPSDDLDARLPSRETLRYDIILHDVRDQGI